MKKEKLIAFAFAAMAFTACSNDSDQTDQENKTIESISVKFVNSGTYADGGVETGLAQENKLYHAFVFAREATPEHAAARPGDFTVVEVGSANATDEIKPGSTDGHLGNIATFKNVRQGDNVYVLANYPNLDLGAAQALARNGEKSEATIKAFIANVQKDYLNKLAFSSKKGDKVEPSATSKYIMAGMGTIPVSPTIPNNTTVTVPVKLDREMAKVFFLTSVTKDPQYEAAGKIMFKNDDGIIVTRIARKVSPFAAQGADWYFPTLANQQDKDWAPTWLTTFDGDGKSANDITQTVAPFFNNVLHNENAKEYRYAWSLNGIITGGNPNSNAAYLYQTEGIMMTPYFYVTPNYSNNAGTATVICTQATYVGAPHFANQDAQKLFVKAYGFYSASNQSKFQTTEGGNAIKFSECVWTNDAMQVVNTYFASIDDAKKGEIAVACGWTNDVDGKKLVTDGITELAKVTKVENLTPGNDDAIINCLAYYVGKKVYYRVDIANYNEDNTISYKNTERNTYYKIRGTITSLGAKSIEDAINSDAINMQIQVTINPWNVVVNDIHM